MNVKTLVHLLSMVPGDRLVQVQVGDTVYGVGLAVCPRDGHSFDPVFTIVAGEQIKDPVRRYEK